MINNLKKSWSVGYKMRIDSNVDDLWNVITKPGHLEMVHPFCKENYPILWDKENSKDVLVYTNGLKLIREFKSWKEKQGYSLEIGTKNISLSAKGTLAPDEITSSPLSSIMSSCF